jgi:5,10-methylene-tetrahydrofolate dehydrogenase/methenyl tetrahydrofolate cyclohydrolase
MKTILLIFTTFKIISIISHSQGLSSSAICHHACHIDTDLAIAEFEEDRSNPIAGKNVLIIGASKGNGNGAAQAFYNAGANWRVYSSAFSWSASTSI